ncbi:MAG TPA: GH25 family lysozyme [Haliangiales bacterium]|nr:GH25 family lysozyme [Haliangiales bacterium]
MRRSQLVYLLVAASACAEPPADVVAETEESVTVCPGPALLNGIDVSVYQGTIDWTKVKAAGITFAFIRVSDGLPPIDTRFHQNWSGARAAGVIRGAYQFYRSNEDPIAQADLLLDTMGALDADDLPPVADVESTDGMTAAQIAANLRKWIDRVEAGTGRRPIIYTGPYFWTSKVGGTSAFADIPLWLANWTSGCPNVPTGFTRWTFWQWSSTGTVDGITGAVDLDKFDGDLAALHQFIRGSVIQGDADAGPPAGPSDAGPPPRPDAAAPPGDECANYACETEVRGGCGVSGGGAGATALILVVLAGVLPSRRARARTRG